MKSNIIEKIKEELNKSKYDLTTYQVELIVKFIQQIADEARKEELEYILTHASGGGSWRRIINQRLDSLNSELKNEN